MYNYTKLIALYYKGKKSQKIYVQTYISVQIYVQIYICKCNAIKGNRSQRQTLDDWYCGCPRVCVCVYAWGLDCYCEWVLELEPVAAPIWIPLQKTATENQIQLSHAQMQCSTHQVLSQWRNKHCTHTHELGVQTQPQVVWQLNKKYAIIRSYRNR